MKKILGFTGAGSAHVSSPASEGHRRNWLGVKPWQWSRLWTRMKDPVFKPSYRLDIIDMRFIFWILSVMAILGMSVFTAVATTETIQTPTQDTAAYEVQNLHRCIAQTNEKKICQAMFVSKGYSIPVRSQP